MRPSAATAVAAPQASASRRTWAVGAATAVLAAAWTADQALRARPIEASPTFNGVPVAASFLMFQALPPLDERFPGLQLAPVFDPKDPEFAFEELGWLAPFYPSSAKVTAPMYEKLSEAEESKLGGSNIKKQSVGKMVAYGTCKMGCASVQLLRVQIFKLNGDLVWEWTRPASHPKAIKIIDEPATAPPVQAAS